MLQDWDTALHLAVRMGQFCIVEALLQNSADTGIRNRVSINQYSLLYLN